MMSRILCITIGLLMLGGAAHVNALALGGYGTHLGMMLPLIALGVAAASLRSGAVWREGRRQLAIATVFCIVGAEVFGFMLTAERIVGAREAAQAEAKGILARRQVASDRLKKAEAGLAAALQATPQLQSALDAKRAVNEAILRDSAKNGCRENCRQLLQAQAGNAEAEVARLRLALDSEREGAQREVAAARVALSALPPSITESPLADRLGVPSWVLDLMSSAFGSVALNGLACCLLAAGSHGARLSQQRVRYATNVDQLTPAVAPRMIEVVQKSAGAPTKFVSECIRPAALKETPLTAVYAAYEGWCERSGHEPVGQAEFAKRLADLFAKASIRVARKQGRLQVVGIDLLVPPPS